MNRKNNGDIVSYPDARVKGINEFLELAKDSEWRPELIDVTLLKALQIAPSKEEELLRALRFFLIIEDSGAPTTRFDDLKKDYKKTIEQIVREKYKTVFVQLPRARMNKEALIAYFSQGGKRSQNTASYQTALFLVLCKEAGIELPKAEARKEEMALVSNEPIN